MCGDLVDEVVQKLFIFFCFDDLLFWRGFDGAFREVFGNVSVVGISFRIFLFLLFLG